MGKITMRFRLMVMQEPLMEKSKSLYQTSQECTKLLDMQYRTHFPQLLLTRFL